MPSTPPNPTQSVPDIRGRFITLGDTVVVAITSGRNRNPELITGVVEKLTSHYMVTIQVPGETRRRPVYNSNCCVIAPTE